jgi:ER membrane protein complex subunit 3
VDLTPYHSSDGTRCESTHPQVEVSKQAICSQVLTGILRHYAAILLQNTPKKQGLPEMRQQRSLMRGVNLRTNGNVLSPTSFQTRRSYMVEAYKNGTFLADPDARGKPRPNPMTDPAMMEGMMGMMKGNMAMMIPQTLIMGWINAFFSGYVIS